MMPTALEIRIIAYALLGLGVMGVTAFATHRLDNARYDAAQAQFAQYRAQVAADAATSQAAARAALQSQIDARTAQESTNAKTIAALTSRADAAQRDAEFAQRLLNAVSSPRTGAGSAALSGSHDQSGAVGAAGASGDRSAFDLPGTLASAAGECRDAIERFAALQAELTPQLKGSTP